MRYSCLLVLPFALVLACGGAKEPTVTADTAATYLPAGLAAADLVRASDVRVFEGEALYEHINGGAEVYHQYGFEQVATASYKAGETEIVADVYRFGDATGAFGLYSMLRPTELRPVPYGLEGFSSSSSVDFVSGRYVVRGTGFDESPQTGRALAAFALALSEMLPGPDPLPAAFSLFPTEGAIPYTARIFAESFLGQAELSGVYCQDYIFGVDTVSLFWTDDNGKLQSWTSHAEKTADPEVLITALAESGATPLTIQHSYYGRIVAALKGNNLVGVVGYTDELARPFASWLRSLQ